MENAFKTHMQEKYPEMETYLIMDLIDSNISKISPISGSEDVSKISIESDLNKHIILKTISEYLEHLKTK